ncbi:MAG: DUF4160 domain-containing protein [Bacilli bacterium]|nr:DUF4160 domain-containing protein [Bacilli bacterium]
MFQRGKEHNPPHIHAYYGDEEGEFLIENGNLLRGSFPRHGTKMVKEFIKRYKKELQEMWDSGIYQKLEPID